MCDALPFLSAAMRHSGRMVDNSSLTTVMEEWLVTLSTWQHTSQIRVAKYLRGQWRKKFGNNGWLQIVCCCFIR
jgi:hypothetical protein